MKFKTKIAVLSAILILQSFGTAGAAAVDNELAIMAAEQDRSDENVETFDPETLENDKNRPKTKEEIQAEKKRLEEERKAAKKKIKEERRRSRDELRGKTPISKNPAPSARTPENNSAPPTSHNAAPVAVTPAVEEIPAVEEVAAVKENPVPVVEEIPAVKPAESPQNVRLPNPVRTYASFNEIVQAVQFTPLYIPKKSGYDITSIITIDNRIAEIRYNRKWEPSVSLNVRTYKRAEGEELKDISGVQNVRWRVLSSNGITTYIAKIDDTKHVAAWAIGNYTFSAYVENLSFAAFHSLVADELVDLTQHYYLG